MFCTICQSDPPSTLDVVTQASIAQLTKLLAEIEDFHRMIKIM